MTRSRIVIEKSVKGSSSDWVVVTVNAEGETPVQVEVKRGSRLANRPKPDPIKVTTKAS